MLYGFILKKKLGNHFIFMSNKRFFLPKAVYEILPLLYLGFGTASLMANHSLGLDILGALLVARGLFSSILRINYRSPHQALTKSPVRHREK